MELNEVCDLIIDCEHKTAPIQETGYPSIRTPNIGQGRFILEGVNRVSEETYQLWTRRAVPQPGDLIMAREAPVGNVAMIPHGLQPCLGQRTLLIRPNHSKVESSFLNYFLNGPHVQGLIQAKTNGATVAHLNMKDVRTMHLPELPSLPAQRRIAYILSAYDELIENSQRRIKILESMARALYREWFIHFRYPGSGRETGNEPSTRPDGHPSPRGRREGNDTENNYPSTSGRGAKGEGAEFDPHVESALGKIPKGWEVKPFTDIADVLSGGTPKTDVAEYWNGDIPFFTPRDTSDCFYVWDTDKHVTELGLSKCASELYPPDTVFITARGTVGKVALPSVPMAMNQSCYALRGKPGISQYFLFLMTLQQVDYLKTNTGGATFDTIVVDTFRRMEVLKPAREIITSFTRQVDAIFVQINTLQRQIQNLRRTRDLLLPRLLSGQLELSETTDLLKGKHE